MTFHGEIATLRSLPDIVAEYDSKVAAVSDEIETFRQAGQRLLGAAGIGGTFGNERIDTGRVSESDIRRSLLRSAWLHVLNGLNLPQIASAKDKTKWEQAMADPAPFTLDNLRATFGPYLENPRATILRGMAEVFADLDPAFRSHEKMKIGVKGLPKRVILTGIDTFYGRGERQLRDILNALAAFQGKPLVTHVEERLILKDGDALNAGGDFTDPYASHYDRRAGKAKQVTVIARGVWLKRFKNGNGHLFFGPEALRDINLALAEYYGEVLPDCPEGRPARRAGTEVSRDLQFYPTPKAVIDRLMGDAYHMKGARVLEPSCGDGRIMDALREAGADVVGVEVDPGRAAAAIAKGHHVLRGNFLECEPGHFAGRNFSDFNAVVMNPPFYGKHYAKHVRHALRFVEPDGRVYAVLPSTARYDHGLLDDLHPQWVDLPAGAFAESGTNICTSIATIRRKA